MTFLQATRAVKGILNKLTPENFDRLLQQVLETVKDADVLHGTITLVFENAVAQPTFAFMYAQLCDRLSKVRAARVHFPTNQGLACMCHCDVLGTNLPQVQTSTECSPFAGAAGLSSGGGGPPADDVQARAPQHLPGGV